jgi:hypothetical protein
MKKTLSFTLSLSLFFGIFIFGKFIIIAQTSQTGQTGQPGLAGTWEAKPYNKHGQESAGKIYLNMRRETSRGNQINGHTYEISEFEGLSADQFSGVSSTANFRLAREAGTIEFTGKFEDGRGSGDFRMAANPTFVEAMRSRGFLLGDEKVFSAITLNLTVAFADEIISAGFKNLDADDLFKARIFKVDSQFIREMKDIGFPNLEMEDLVKARIFKIDAQYAREVKEMGFGNDSLERLVKLRIFKVTPEFLREMKQIGFSDLTSEQAVKLQIFKVTPEFARSVKAEGLSDLSVEEAVKLRIFKVDADFIRRARAQGHKSLDVEELVNLKIHGRVK